MGSFPGKQFVWPANAFAWKPFKMQKSAAGKHRKETGKVVGKVVGEVVRKLAGKVARKLAEKVDRKVPGKVASNESKM